MSVLCINPPTNQSNRGSAIQWFCPLWWAFSGGSKSCSHGPRQSIKHFTIVIYNSRVVWLGNCPYYDSRVVNYDRKMFIRLATELKYRTMNCISRICGFLRHFPLFLLVYLYVHLLGSFLQIVASKRPDAQKIKISPTYSMLTLEKNSPQLYRPKDPIFLDLIWAQSGLFLFMTLVPISLKIAKWMSVRENWLTS